MVYVLTTDEYEVFGDGLVGNEWQEIFVFADKGKAHKAMMNAVANKVSTIYNLVFEGELKLKNMTDIAVTANSASVEFEYEDSIQKFRCVISEKEIQ